MTYTSDQVFEQALEDKYASNIDGNGYEGRIACGTKITRDNRTGEVEFFNTTQGGSYYVKLSPAEEHIFYSKDSVTFALKGLEGRMVVGAVHLLPD